MTDKERLEEIKKILEFTLLFFNRKSGNTQFIEDFIWLVEQVERVEELEKEKDEWKDTAQSYYMTNQELREQNKRYREALNSVITLWIASTDATDDTWLAHEMSETARKALEGDDD